MIAYDVVQWVRPGTMTSTPAGRWLVQCFRDEVKARAYAERCNDCAGVDDIRYTIETHDDECTGRATRHGDFVRGEPIPTDACTCGYSWKH